MGQHELDELYFQTVDAFEQERLDDASQLLAQLVEREPNSERTVILQAHRRELEGQLEAATRQLEEYVKSHLQSAHAGSNLARLQWQMGDHEAALRSLNLALAKEPNQERSLHLFAAILEQKFGFDHAFHTLLGLGRRESAWLPGWVAANLAGTRHQSERWKEAVLQCARRQPPRFPPNPETFLKLLAGLGESERSAAWEQLRPYCDQATRLEGDQRFAGDMSRQSAASVAVETLVRGSLVGGPSGHALLKDRQARLFTTPFRLLKPEIWQAEDLIGPLGRGLSLLLAEVLTFRHSRTTESVFLCDPQGGLYFQNTLPQVGDLSALRTAGTERMVSCYLSRAVQGDFTLDCEQYDGGGAYLGHLTVRDQDPGRCVGRLAAQLADSLPEETREVPPFGPDFGIEGLLARDTAASFLLCDQGALELAALPNPGLSLDLLAEYAAESQEPLGLLALWNAVCAAARLGVPSATEQRQMLEPVLSKDEVMLPFRDAG